MPVDPRLNCAAEICCNPPRALAARVSILCDLGVPEEDAPRMAAKMKEMGIAFTSASLAEAIREIAYPAPSTPES
jgi:hypothetical protein